MPLESKHYIVTQKMFGWLQSLENREKVGRSHKDKETTKNPQMSMDNLIQPKCTNIDMENANVELQTTVVYKFLISRMA